MARRKPIYRLYRKLHEGETKSWQQSMNAREAAQAVYHCLIDNGVTDAAAARRIAGKFQDDPTQRITCACYQFWATEDETKG